MRQIQGLVAFVEIADAGSLAAAARRLGVTPAAVSKNLLRLEAQLGVRLLQRSTRRLRLTAEGEVFLEKARHALRALDEAVAEVSQSAAEPIGKVRLSVGVSFGRHWVLPALPALTQAHPRLQIEVDLDNRPVDLVAEGYDIGIRGARLEAGSLVARRICALPTVLVASPGYLRRAGVPERVADLAQHRCVQRRVADGSLSAWEFRERTSKRRTSLQLSPALIVNDGEAGMDLALAGAGVAQAGLYHTLPYLRSGRLKLVLADLHDPGAREFVLHYPHRRYLAPRVRVVVDALLAHFSAAADLHLKVAELPSEFHAVARLSTGNARASVRAPS